MLASYGIFGEPRIEERLGPARQRRWTFDLTSPSFLAGNAAGFVVAGDFNGDGKPDLAVVDSSSNVVTILTNLTPAPF